MDKHGTLAFNEEPRIARLCVEIVFQDGDSRYLVMKSVNVGFSLQLSMGPCIFSNYSFSAGNIQADSDTPMMTLSISIYKK